MKKLYRVDLRMTYYALAESAYEAEELLDDMDVAFELSSATVVTTRPVEKGEDIAYGWAMVDYVYASDEADAIPLEEAMEAIKERGGSM